MSKEEEKTSDNSRYRTYFLGATVYKCVWNSHNKDCV